MKNILLVSFLLLFVFPAFSQYSPKSPALKIGVGLPVFFGNEANGTEHHKITGLPSVSIEKPFSIVLNRTNRFTINPGLAYYLFLEDEVSGNINITPTGLGNATVGKDIKLNHHSVNIYSKWLVQKAIGERRKEGIVYLGAITGLHVHTKSYGEKTIYSNNAEDPFEKLTINENGDNFYDGLYYGALIGFQAPAKLVNTIKPSFELGYYQDLVRKGNEKASVIQLTVFLGFRKY